VSAGINGAHFWLPTKALPTNKADLEIGQPIECVTTAVNDGAQSATLRAHPKAVYEALTRSGNLAFTSLVPGMLVNCVVDKKVENGVLVNFLGMFYGVIDMSSLSRPLSSADWAASINEGETLHARIVLVDQATKSIRLSVRPHVLEMRGPRNLPALGDVVENLTILTVQKTAGVLMTRNAAADGAMDVDEEEETKASTKKKAIDAALKAQRDKDEEVVAVFVGKNSLAASLDAEEQASAENIEFDKIPKVYKVGGEIASVRVKGYNLVEGWAIGTNMTDFVEGQVVHTSDAKVGQLLPVTVDSIKDFGLVVRLGSGKVTAVCPTFHSADVVVEGKLKKKFKVGQELTMRVWETSSSGIIMTNKKAMVDLPKELIVSSLTAPETDLGKVVTGVVSDVNAQGVLVRFFNKVRGTVPMSVLVAQGVMDPEEAYRPGQVLRAVVIGKTLNNSDAAKNVLYLGLNINKDINAVLKLIDLVTVPAGTITYATAKTDLPVAVTDDSKKTEKASASTDSIQSEQAEFVSGEIYKIEGDSALVRLDNGKAGKIHKHHFFDLASTADAVFGAAESDIKIGARVENALVLNYNRGVANLTAKPLLVFAAKNHTDGESDLAIPSKVADLTPGQVVAGFVVKVDTYGVIVCFRGSLSALVPRPNIADKFTPTPVGIFTAGDSVRCVVQRVDNTTEKAILSFKSSIVTPSAGSITYLAAFLKEQHQAAVAVARSSKKLFPNWQKYAIGSVIKATVSSIESYGVVLTADDNTTMLLARHTSAEKLAELSVGKSVKARVLDLDFANSVLEVALDNAFTKAEEKTPAKKGKAAPAAEVLTVGSKVEGQVALVRSNYLVVLLKKSLGFVSLADFHNPKPDAEHFKEGQKISVRVQVAPAETGSPAYPHDGVAVLNISDEASGVRAARQQKDAAPAGASVSDIKARFIEKLRVGQLVPWVVSEVSPLEVKVLPERNDELGIRIKASIHLSGAVDSFQSFDNLQKALKKANGVDREAIHASHPFHGLKTGSKVLAHVLQVRREASSNGEEEFSVYLALSVHAPTSIISALSLTPASVEADGSGVLPFHRMTQSHGKDELKCPSFHAAVVTKIEEVGVIVALTPYLTARLNFVDVSNDAELIELFAQNVFVGLRLVVGVTHLSKDGQKIRQIRVSRAAIESFVTSPEGLFDITKSRNKLNDGAISEPVFEEGQIVTAVLNLHNARVPKPPAISLSLAGQKYGRVDVTEIWDREDWQDLSELQAKVATHASSNSQEVLSLPDSRAHGQIVQARVLSVNDGYVELSLRDSRVNTAKISVALKPDPIPTEGTIVPVYVANASTRGCFVRLSGSITGKVLMRDLSDDFITNPEDVFPSGKLVQARLLSVSQIDSEAKLSLKDSVVIGDTKAREEIKKIAVGSTHTGTVQRVTQDGVFVTLQGTSLTGLSRRVAAITDEKKSLTEEFEIGDVVRCKVLSVAKNSLKIGLGLRAQYFKGDSAADAEDSEAESDDNSEEMDIDEAEEESGDEEDGSEEEDEEEGSDDEDEDEEDSEGEEGNFRMLEEGEGDTDDELEAMIKAAALPSDSEDEQNGSDEDEENSEEDSESESEEEAPVAKKAAKGAKKASKAVDSDSESEEEGRNVFSKSSASVFGKKGKDVLGDLQWDDSAPLVAVAPKSKGKAQAVESDASDSEAESDAEGAGKKSKLRSRQKESARRKTEADIRNREAALADGTLVPEQKDDFERMLIAQPNSSFLWVQYMAFHLQSADVDSARAIAARALRTIDYREEDEKYNVWIALLNMEHKYGSMETLDKAFTKAVAESKVSIRFSNPSSFYCSHHIFNFNFSGQVHLPGDGDHLRAVRRHRWRRGGVPEGPEAPPVQEVQEGLDGLPPVQAALRRRRCGQGPAGALDAVPVAPQARGGYLQVRHERVRLRFGRPRPRRVRGPADHLPQALRPVAPVRRQGGEAGQRDPGQTALRAHDRLQDQGPEHEDCVQEVPRVRDLARHRRHSGAGQAEGERVC